jgi:hypothetical protein
MTIVQVYWYVCKLFIGQLKEWLNKHAETLFFFSFFTPPTCQSILPSEMTYSFFFRSQTYKHVQKQDEISIRWCNCTIEKEDLTKKNALIRKCCEHMSSLSLLYKHYRLPVLEARHVYIYIYVCTQVIDKTRRGERKLLSHFLSLLTQYRKEELEQRQTVSDICIWNKRWRKWSIHTFSVISDNDQLG